MIGDPVVRIEGPLKVSGTARYSAERELPERPLYGMIVGAGIGRGLITSIDTAAAEAAPGVRLVWTHRNAPAQGIRKPKTDMFGARPELVDDVVHYAGMPVALVVAESFEQARAAAALVAVAYEAGPGRFDLVAATGDAEWDEAFTSGDLDRAMAEADATIDVTYGTPYHFGLPMEPHGCIADWRDGHLTLYVAAQMLSFLVDGLAETLLLERAQITVDAMYVGGGFGSKISLHAEAVLASLASIALEAPVKLMMTRRQIFGLVGHRPATISRIRLAASRDGKLSGIGHEAWAQTSDHDSWKEGPSSVSRALYAAPNRLMRTAYAQLDLGPAEPVRGPGEVAGLIAFESAMDELAEKLDLDPLALRLANDTHIDAQTGKPLSSRRLMECLRVGADRFGWDERPTAPATRRDGNQRVGFGLAASIRGHFQAESEASVRIEPEGRVIVRSDMTDLGMGTYTIVAQVAADALGVPMDQITVQLARTSYPKGFGAGGSIGAAATTVAVDRACAAAREQIAAIAPGYNDIFAEVRRHFPQGLETRGKTLDSADDPNYQAHAQYTYGATFTEVGVDAFTGEIRVRRMLGVFSCGRILNALTARSQLIGGMVWGIGAALHEGAYADARTGLWVNGDFAEYLIPTHADVPALEAIMLEDFDAAANHLGVKGIGELGSGGTAAAVANAVYNATGVRVREFPITLEKVLAGLGEVG
jgi:xanthine dehydrogenase YagR molybdenum-binding subunit